MGRGGEKGSATGEELLYGPSRPLPARSKRSPLLFDLTISGRILDQEILLEAARDLGRLPDDGPVESILSGILFSGNRVRAGTEVLSSKTKLTDPAWFRAEAEIRVFSPELLIATAQRSYAENFFDDTWKPQSLGAALAEAYGASALLPSPDLIGLEIHSQRASQRR